MDSRTLNNRLERLQTQDKKWLHGAAVVRATWGWAITAHKSQGSEWPNVLVIDDGFGQKDEDRAKWLYTVMTRASERLTIAV